MPGPMLRTLPAYVMSSSLQSFEVGTREEERDALRGWDFAKPIRVLTASKGSARSWIPEVGYQALPTRHYFISNRSYHHYHVPWVDSKMIKRTRVPLVLEILIKRIVIHSQSNVVNSNYKI